MMMNEIRFADLFCGIGGLRLGLEKANSSKQASGKIKQTSPNLTGQGNRGRLQPVYRCVWGNDNDKYACQIYRKHWGDVWEGDIRTVDPSTIPEHDLLCAGFPCQSFSIAGKRGGFEDTRGTLFFEICRIARAKRTPYLLLENVKGLLSHDNGDTFQTILESLDELGYDCQWQVLNSKDYGVPQNRERVFIIGHLRGQPKPKVFPIGKGIEAYNGIYNKEMIYGQDNPRAKVMEYVKNQVQGNFYRNANGELVAIEGDEEARDGCGFSLPPSKVGDKGDGLLLAQMSPPLQMPQNECGILDGKGDIEQKKRYEGKPQLEEDGMASNRHMGTRPKSAWGVVYTQDEACSTIDTKQKDRDGAVIVAQNNGYIRRLTPLECERLQGFPDNWTEGISDTQRYKCLGNAVTTNVIEAIGQQLLEGLDEQL